MEPLTIAATDANLDAVLSFIDRKLTAAKCPDATQARIDIAVSELFTNIAHYSYTSVPGNVDIKIEITENPRAAAITFSDYGAPFNPLSAKDPDTTLTIDNRKEGGLGIYIVKNLMDEVAYKYENGKNIIRIIKAI